MVQKNKVLTVSYGTFSCTLEGFDDSFETMKAIAEYFRDLAAEDRYFGAEPPQPDAEKLTRIAQRDASRPVRARQDENGLHLRATAGEQPEEGTLTMRSEPSDRTSEAEFFGGSKVEDTAPSAAANSIAAKLQRIRAVVSHSEDNSPQFVEDDEEPFLNPKSPPVDAVAAAFAAGALAENDFAPSASDSDVPPAESEVTPVQEPEQDTLPEPQPLASEPEVEDAQQDAPSLPAVSETEAEKEEDPQSLLEDEELSAEPEDVLTSEDEDNLLKQVAEVEESIFASEQTPSIKTPNLDQDVSRLMAQADEQMDDPAATSTRDTYLHLRTAVAAENSERQDGTKPAAENADQQYRGDLASVVSPRRPEVQVTSIRPEYDGAAPLKLVAEQRIDTTTDADDLDAPVTPRRVTAEQEDETTEQEGGFASFAQEQGAFSLQDLLEAAAAYLSFIEGQEQFSRPQLMNKVRSLKQEDFNREESLRSFGQLLRDGKIEKAGGGRFAASSDIGFRPEGKRAVG